jgi:hypothetical protein
MQRAKRKDAAAAASGSQTSEQQESGRGKGATYESQDKYAKATGRGERRSEEAEGKEVYDGRSVTFHLAARPPSARHGNAERIRLMATAQARSPYDRRPGRASDLPDCSRAAVFGARALATSATCRHRHRPAAIAAPLTATLAPVAATTAYSTTIVTATQTSASSPSTKPTTATASTATALSRPSTATLTSGTASTSLPIPTCSVATTATARPTF